MGSDTRNRRAFARARSKRRAAAGESLYAEGAGADEMVRAWEIAERATRRETEIGMLDALLACPELGIAEGDAFTNMHRWLVQAGSPATLTPRQRRWVADRFAAFDLSMVTPAERNGSVPRGREVPVPAVLQHLPKKPPTRREENDDG